MVEASPALRGCAIAAAALAYGAPATTLFVVAGYRRILAPTDFSECADAAMEHAVYLAGLCAAELDVLTAFGEEEDPRPYWFVPGEPSANEAADAYRTDSGRQLMALVTHLETRLPTVTRGRLQFGDPAKTIVRAAEADHYDLIVMGTHGRHGLSHALVGSVADAVVRRSPCPVLLVRTSS